MPIATLTFSLPEEEDEFRLALNARKLSIALDEIDMKLRNDVKYENVTNKVAEYAREIRSMIPTGEGY